jgi:hypothetical protein
MPSVVERLPKPVRRLGPSGLLIVCGLAVLVAVRQLPPDASLRQVKDAGVLLVCSPPALPPLLRPDGAGGFDGREAELVRAVASEIGVPAQWNTQPGWGRGADPSDWGVRPSACNLIAGGIVAGERTRALMDLVVYDRVSWALAGDREGETIGLYLPFWGVDRGTGARAIRDLGARPKFLFDAERARKALETGRVGAVLTLEPVADWLAGEGRAVRTLDALPVEALAIATWKGRTTLNRAVRRAVPQAGSAAAR